MPRWGKVQTECQGREMYSTQRVFKILQGWGAIRITMLKKSLYSAYNEEKVDKHFSNS